MRISVSKIGTKPKDFSLRLTLADMPRFAQTKLVKKLDLQATVTMSLVQGHIEQHTHWQCRMQTFCAYCLEDFEATLQGEYVLKLLPKIFSSSEKNEELDWDDLDQDYYEGQEINLAKYIEDHLILEVPDEMGCRDFCAGFCQYCGANKNFEQCSCKEKRTHSLFQNVHFK